MTTLSEAEIEGVLLDQLLQLGYSCVNDVVSGPDGDTPEREAYSDTILAGRPEMLSLGLTHKSLTMHAKMPCGGLLLQIAPRSSKRTAVCTAFWSKACRWSTGPTMAQSAAMPCGWWTQRMV